MKTLLMILASVQFLPAQATEQAGFYSAVFQMRQGLAAASRLPDADLKKLAYNAVTAASNILQYEDFDQKEFEDLERLEQQFRVELLRQNYQYAAKLSALFPAKSQGEPRLGGTVKKRLEQIRNEVSKTPNSPYYIAASALLGYKLSWPKNSVAQLGVNMPWPKNFYGDSPPTKAGYSSMKKSEQELESLEEYYQYYAPIPKKLLAAFRKNGSL